VITGESVSVDGGAGAGQQDVIGKALARINTAVEPFSFVGLFGDRIINDAQGTITLLVSPNGYPDYLELLERCDREGLEYTWFYPYYGTDEPEVSESLGNHVQYVCLKR